MLEERLRMCAVEVVLPVKVLAAKSNAPSSIPDPTWRGRRDATLESCPLTFCSVHNLEWTVASLSNLSSLLSSLWQIHLLSIYTDCVQQVFTVITGNGPCPGVAVQNCQQLAWPRGWNALVPTHCDKPEASGLSNIFKPFSKPTGGKKKPFVNVHSVWGKSFVLLGCWYSQLWWTYFVGCHRVQRDGCQCGQQMGLGVERPYPVLAGLN